MSQKLCRRCKHCESDGCWPSPKEILTFVREELLSADGYRFRIKIIAMLLSHAKETQIFKEEEVAGITEVEKRGADSFYGELTRSYFRQAKAIVHLLKALQEIV